MKNIKTVGVVGAGTMGSALAQKFAQEGFQVILADRETSYVMKGLSNISQTLEDGVLKKVFTPEQKELYLNKIKGTDQLKELYACDIIIEAIFENLEAKKSLFNDLSKIIPATTILASNTSSFAIDDIATAVKHPERFIGLHYFYHAAKNRLVEVIPGTKTSEEVVKQCYRFSINCGKDPIFTKDCYGFAVNRFFVPWLNESVKLLQEKISTVEIIDAVCMRLFGIGMGPFALMNATGVPIAYHAEKTLEAFGPSYKVASLLEDQANKKQNWEIKNLPEAVNDATANHISERMLGSVFFVCLQILQENVCSAIDLNKGAKIGLKWRKGPVDLLQQYGKAEVERLVNIYASHYGEPMPVIDESKWKMDFVTLTYSGENAIITFNRPEDLNALNESVISQLENCFFEAEQNSRVKKIFLTGTGKAFVAGADIKFFVKNIQNHTLDKIVRFTEKGQQLFKCIDESPKTIIALLNGMALGGGLELALCADYIYANPKVVMAFPETGIGIYPGLGGTQRTAKRVGKSLAKYLVLSGNFINAKEATEIGLIDGVLTLDEQFDLMDQSHELPPKKEKKLNEKWEEIEKLFNDFSYQKIINGALGELTEQNNSLKKLSNTLSAKAPIAMQLANQLIEDGKGPQSELINLVKIFSTHDALKGLTSIGKKVVYEGK